MSLNPPSQPSGPAAAASRPDPEALLLQAVSQRNRQQSLDRLQRCVHRRGHDWLLQFQTVTLPTLEGAAAAAWFEDLLGGSPVEGVHSTPGQAVGLPLMPEENDKAESSIEQRASAAVDGAIASMLAEFPELVAPSRSPGFGLPLTQAPPPPPVPEVLPARMPPPVFSFSGPPAGTGAEAAPPPQGLQTGSFPGTQTGSFNEVVSTEPLSHLEPSSSAVFVHDPAPFEAPAADFAAPKQQPAATIATDLGSRLLRRLSRTDWLGLARSRFDRGEFSVSVASAVAPRPGSTEGEPLQDPPASPDPDGAADLRSHQPANGGESLTWPPDPLARMVRPAGHRSGQENLADAAPAPPALADLRAWLPDSSLPKAS